MRGIPSLLALAALAAPLLACGGLPIEIKLKGDEPTTVYVEVPVAAEPVAVAQQGPAPQGKVVQKAAPAPKPAVAAPAPTPKKAVAKGGDGGVQVLTMAAVMVYIDGQLAGFDPIQGYILHDLGAGSHQLEVINALGKTVASTSFDVAAGQRTRFRYKAGGSLESLGQAPLPREAPAPEPVAEPAPVAPALGSASIVGIDVSAGGVWVDGREIAWSGSHNAFVARDLAEGLHSLRVESNGVIVYQGDLSVAAHSNHRCVMAWTEGWTLDCHYTDRAL